MLLLWTTKCKLNDSEYVEEYLNVTMLSCFILRLPVPQFTLHRNFVMLLTVNGKVFGREKLDLVEAVCRLFFLEELREITKCPLPPRLPSPTFGPKFRTYFQVKSLTPTAHPLSPLIYYTAFTVY
jgi:hypothetical protein